MSGANKSPRRRAREFALQGVYQWLLSQSALTAIEAQMAEVGGFDKCDRDLFIGLLRGTISNAPELQVGFAPFVDRPLNELSPVERSVLLISTFELIHRPDTPYRVIINEAIELTKAYGGTDGHKFVNGVLDKMTVKLRPDEVEAFNRERGARGPSSPDAKLGQPPPAMPSEFALIRRHFTRPARHTDLAVGDDAALIRPGPGMQLAISTDMLVAGTHFFADTEPEALGWKTLAVNVSDIAAMGAQPRWVVLAASLPHADEAWIGAFAQGFFACCEAFGIDAIGGDTTRGPLNLCPTIFGEVPIGRAIRRSGAVPGDDLWVSGTPGRAALGLAHLRGEVKLAEDWREACLAALHRPQPRVGLGLALRGIASAMLDVSDGLLGDLSHILAASQVGARIDADALPLAGLQAACGDTERAFAACTAGGDDYELLFTAAPCQRPALAALAQQLALPLSRIGTITPAADGLQLRRPDGTSQSLAARGYDHFGAAR